MSITEAMWIAANRINNFNNLPMYQDFCAARKMSDEDFYNEGNYSLSVLRDRLIQCVEADTNNNVGWWYGRLTDSRWDKTI